MTLTTIEKRALTHVGANIRQAISVLEARFGGVLTHDSGHGKYTGDVATTWIFTFPRHHGAQVAVPMNKQKLVFLMRGKTLDEQALEPLIADIALVTHRYTNATQGVASSVLGRRAPFLNPSVRNPLLRVIPRSKKSLSYWKSTWRIRRGKVWLSIRCQPYMTANPLRKTGGFH